MVINLEKKIDAFKLCSDHQLPKEVNEGIVSATLKRVAIYLLQVNSRCRAPEITFIRPANVDIHQLGQLFSFILQEVTFFFHLFIFISNY